jgi:predicted Fe-S protein YdhL (DUF1289 family)
MPNAQRQEPLPASPCIDVCRLDGNDRCIGCGRTLDEIARWSTMSAEEQRAVLERLRQAAR